jgi:hypothetical protein
MDGKIEEVDEDEVEVYKRIDDFISNFFIILLN